MSSLLKGFDNMARDRVFINSEYRTMVDQMKDTDILGFSMVENKDSFMLAVAMGLDNPTDVKNKDGWFLTKNIKTDDKALMAAVLLGMASDDADVDAYSDLDKAIDLCEKCAETGFYQLKNKIIESDYDVEIFEGQLLKGLDVLYEVNVENNLD